jgi:hypothetical protein
MSTVSTNATPVAQCGEETAVRGSARTRWSPRRSSSRRRMRPMGRARDACLPPLGQRRGARRSLWLFAELPAGRMESTGSRRPSSGPGHCAAAGRGARVLSARALVSMSGSVGPCRLSPSPRSTRRRSPVGALALPRTQAPGEASSGARLAREASVRSATSSLLVSRTTGHVAGGNRPRSSFCSRSAAG